MPKYIEKPNLINLKVEIDQTNKNAFADWQAKLNAEIANFSGFLSLEFMALMGQKGWMIVQRFTTEQELDHWKHSPQYQHLRYELKKMALRKEIFETDERSNLQDGVTEVIVTQVNPEKEKDYKLWSGKIHKVEAKFPGFRGVYVQPPLPNQGSHWITLLQFDNMMNLDKWLESPERKELIEESQPLVTSLQTHRIMSPYAGWFASLAKIGEVPPGWKQTMIVLLVLYPIVMLQTKFLSPLLVGLSPPLAMFISNAMSAALIAFPAAPLAIKLLKWWLIPKSKLHDHLGTLFVLFLYLVEILLFLTL